MVFQRRAVNVGMSYRELPERERNILLEICDECKVGPRDLIDDPIPEDMEQSPEHEDARRRFIQRLSLPLYIRSRLARERWYSAHELGLILNRSPERVEELRNGYTECGGGKG